MRFLTTSTSLSTGLFEMTKQTMAKLFNGISKKIISEKPSVGRTTNYLKYAIGEIVLVVIGIIKDNKLRSQIINVFENDYNHIDDIKDIKWKINNVNRPYYLTNFVDIDFSVNAKPNNLETLWKDSYYKNIVHYRLVTLKGNQKNIYTKTIKDIKLLLKLINQNID